MPDPTSQTPVEWPVTRIGSGPQPLAKRLQELWHYREVLYLLAARDILVRYRQTLLGVAWAILQPLAAMLLFTLFFGKLAHMPSEGIPYALFAYAGLLPWTFFSTAVTNSSNSLIANPDLLSKVYVPRPLVTGAAIVASLMDFGIAFMLLFGLMAYYRVALTPRVLLLPLLVILTALFAFAIGTWMAVINVKYRDVRHALPFLIQLWLFASPVIYPSSFLPPLWRPLLMLNPLTGIIEGYRASLFGWPFPWPALGVSVVLTLAVLRYAMRSMRQAEATFADLI